MIYLYSYIALGILVSLLCVKHDLKTSHILLKDVFGYIMIVLCWWIVVAGVTVEWCFANQDKIIIRSKNID